MLCQECNQREASLHFTKIINGKKTEFHICDQCAKEKGDYIPGSNSYSIHQLLSGLLDFEQPMTSSDSSISKNGHELSCKVCKMTYPQFAEIGRFGCAECYKTFGEKLTPIFKRIHSGNAVHGGKIPKRLGEDLHIHKEIEQLKSQMQGLIQKEEFEKAAEVRDQIRSLEKSLDEKKEG
ncbi:UvrB/UvrC motif-containing protein [Bacillus shivajii]|uniref:UvrB/UvrC motif-containing protein n=1 Tax=Bacillus shivajii TaxID=1983719 RepID=UPI001CFA7843|nr:UvrB/UvrC motif-containing protein [Bacillus shivajii]UCZ53342.1 UvrB/UvrC motif-containing protein [Bacillus shivajii]